MLHTKDKLLYQGTQAFNDDYQSFYIAPTHEPADGKLVVPISAAYCRDQQVGVEMRKIINNGDLETDKLRLLFVYMNYNEKIAHEWFLRGLNCVRAFEQKAGWPLTRAIAVDMPGSKAIGFYTRASRRWIKAPYMVTLYVLLIRMCQDKCFDGVKNFKSLMDAANIKSSAHFARDGGHIASTRDYWEALALGYPMLFEQYKLSYYWSMDRLNYKADSGYAEGVQKLCNGDTHYDGITKQLREIKADIDKNGKLTLTRKKAKK